MHIGLAPIKGLRLVARDEVFLGEAGPLGDRLFAFVADGKALKTVQHPQLMSVEASYDDQLRLQFPDGRELHAIPSPGEACVVDYWGREVRGHTVVGPWADAVSEMLGKQVELVQAAPGGFVYGHAVSVVTSAELDRLGNPDPARFRATFVVDTNEVLQPGQHWQLGDAVIQISAPIVRCAVINHHPVTGQKDADLLRRLAKDLHLGVDATVISPGTVRLGDTAKPA